MPELDLDQSLRAARTQLLDDITLPELTAVRTRARSIRRRRRLAAAGAALASLVAIGSGTLLMSSPPTAGPEPAASDQFQPGSVWRAGGLTLNGLTGRVLDQPGEVYDIEFADADHGFALSGECKGSDPCLAALAATVDGGHTWVDWPGPIWSQPLTSPPQLQVLDRYLVMIATGNAAWFGEYPGADWISVAVDDLLSVPSIATNGRLWLPRGSTESCVADAVAMVRPGGVAAWLEVQPPGMQVCRVAPAPAADGAWWVGGRVGDLPAVAVTRDLGRSWTVIDFPGSPAGTWGQVSTRGAEVYASLVSLRGGDPHPETLTVHTVYRSLSGSGFVPYLQTMGTVVGDVVPLLDGRLVAAGPAWYISAGAGEPWRPTGDAMPWRPIGDAMPWVGRLQRSPGGWLAYDLFDAGWSARSTDGVTWQKVNLR